jgi:carbon monoxide dehydrogenase subunit G
MATFSQGIISDDRIEVDQQRIHRILTDPTRLAQLTPLVKSIQDDGNRWTWQLVGINALGIQAAPSFTTLMDIGPEKIAFRPAPDVDERATATGHLTVTRDGDTHTTVAIELVATVELPVPKMAARGVQSVMFQTMKAGGARFADNLLTHLGSPPHRGLNVRPVD